MGDDDLAIILTAVATVVAVAGGFASWAILALTTGGEAWDSGSWWTIALPLLAILDGALGYVVPRRVWRWGAWIIAGQFVAMILLTFPQSSLGLLPLAVVLVLLPMWAVFTVIAMMGAVIARGGWDREILRR